MEDLQAALAKATLTAHQRRDLAEAKQRLYDWFRRLIDDPAPAPLTRLELGRLVGRQGDPRPGIVPAGWTSDETRPFALDPGRDFDWVAISTKERFKPGSDPGDPDAYNDEKGGEEVELPAFEIARYPVTQSQFSAFVRAGGYGEPGATSPPAWWRFSDEAQDWWHGGNPGLDQALEDPDFPEDQKGPYRQWVEQRGSQARRGPWFQDDPRYRDWVLPNHPVIGVSWFEAMAFCGWLTEDLRRRRLLGDDQAICLPTEIQWERAARGTERRRWPWGNDWQEGAANTEEAGLQATSAVGLFPADSPERLRDMAGNVWEWTATRWGPLIGKPTYRWPLDPKDDRDASTGADLRITRGGSWYNTPRSCRGASRSRHLPLNWNDLLGFRLVRVSLAHSVS